VLYAWFETGIQFELDLRFFFLFLFTGSYNLFNNFFCFLRKASCDLDVSSQVLNEAGYRYRHVVMRISRQTFPVEIMADKKKILRMWNISTIWVA
jgi:hypothetical protein